MKREVKMLEVFDDSRCRKKLTTDWDNSNVVSRQLNAIVNPNVKVIIVLNWRLNSLLNLVPILKNFFIFRLILVLEKKVY
jgi:hypothetical protein